MQLRTFHFSVHMGQFLELVGDKIPTFVGIKFFGNNIEEAFEALRAANGRFIVFSGHDEVKFKKN